VSAMVLGAGGAAQAVARGLKDRGARGSIAARSEEKGREAAKRLGCEFCAWQDRGAYVVQVLANCTSVGMFPNVDESPMEQQTLRAGTVVFDAVYNPETTYLLRMARQRGCKTVSGVEMFVGQACLQYKLFTGEKASGSFMRKVVRDAMSAVRTVAEETK
ncbi:MAG: shikimate dehydrogenase, partial [Thermoguttaceae bacterium]|nr:shikimate dehydrogenase [Thermoguttaceae bacterium]